MALARFPGSRSPGSISTPRMAGTFVRLTLPMIWTSVPRRVAQLAGAVMRTRPDSGARPALLPQPTSKASATMAAVCLIMIGGLLLPPVLVADLHHDREDVVPS